MADAVDQPGVVVGLFAQHLVQVLVDFGYLVPVPDVLLEVVEHLHYREVRAAVQRAFERTDRCGDRRVGVGARRTGHAYREGRVVTAAVFGMQHQCAVEGFRFQFGELAFEHVKEIFGN